jgi:hypothetical protein
MAIATTIKELLRQYQWAFKEARMVKQWNELARLANGQDDGTNVAFTGRTFYGDIVFSTDTVTPEFIPALADDTEGRDGTGGRYADKKYPNNGLQEFIVLS